MDIEIKKITKRNSGFLREMLYEAIYIPDFEKPLPESIVDKPELIKYINNWGRKGDTGLISEHKGEMIGAVWARIFPESQKGYGFVDKKTPEISIAVKKQYRNRGIGKRLMLELIDKLKNQGFNSISLSVNKDNRAVNLYKRFGFEVVEESKTHLLMKKAI